MIFFTRCVHPDGQRIRFHYAESLPLGLPPWKRLPQRTDAVTLALQESNLAQWVPAPLCIGAPGRLVCSQRWPLLAVSDSGSLGAAQQAPRCLWPAATLDSPYSGCFSNSLPRGPPHPPLTWRCPRLSLRNPWSEQEDNPCLLPFPLLPVREYIDSIILNPVKHMYGPVAPGPWGSFESPLCGSGFLKMNLEAKCRSGRRGSKFDGYKWQVLICK